MEKMARSTIEAFFNRLPFLREIVTSQVVECVRESSATPEIYDARPKGGSLQIGYQLTVPTRDDIYLLNRNGILMTEVGVERISWKWYDFRTWYGRRYFPETVREAIIRHRLRRCRVNSELGYIVVFERAEARLTLMKVSH